jgi:hypothetical protein
MSTGPRTDAGKVASALGTHGIYATAMNPEEVEAVTQADDTLANELLVARVQLRRALQSWDTWSAGVVAGSAKRLRNVNALPTST